MRWAPVILLVLVALHHRWRMHRLRQTSWKGGSFSMFSEMWRNSLVTEIWIQDKNLGPLPLVVADQRENHLLLAAVAIPTRKRILAWARWAAAAEWKRCGNFAHLPFGMQGGDALSVTKVVLRLRSIDFDASGTHSAEELQSYAVDAKGGELKVAP